MGPLPKADLPASTSNHDLYRARDVNDLRLYEIPDDALVSGGDGIAAGVTGAPELVFAWYHLELRGRGLGTSGQHFGPTAQDAQELLAILGSVDFNANLAERNKLAPILMRHVSLTTRLTLALTGGSLPQHPNRWTLYRLMQSRLDSTFEESTGNFMVKFIDPDPAQAKRILDLYVDSLRQKLRDRAIVSSEAAVKALEAASASTSDALMVGQLDQLLAQQIQELGTAEVQADFAFVVIDSPTVPPMPYFPRPIIFTLIAAILTPFLMCAWLILRERLERLSTFVREEEAVLREVESSRTASSAKYT